MNQPTYPPQPNNSTDRELKIPSLSEMISILQHEVSKKGKDKMDKLLDRMGFLKEEDFL